MKRHPPTAPPQGGRTWPPSQRLPADTTAAPPQGGRTWPPPQRLPADTPAAPQGGRTWPPYSAPPQRHRALPPAPISPPDWGEEKGRWREAYLLPLISYLSSLLILSCSTATPEGGGGLAFARYLSLEGDTAAIVWNPWAPGEVLQRVSLDAAQPAERIVSATSLHAHLAQRLGAEERLLGVMDAAYIVIDTLRDAVAEGRVEDMGSSVTPDLERLRAARCDMLLTSPFEHAGHGPLDALGIPVIDCADYLETSPLGRAEWMRLFGRLFGTAARADSLFQAETEAYQALRDLVADGTGRDTRPRLLVGTRQGASWHVPSGESYLAALYADAGADYPFADTRGAGSVALDIETVIARAHDADVWIITYAAPEPLTYEALAAQDDRYTAFAPYRARRIWACNTLAVPYYDVLPFAPSALLRDLIAILHPDILPDHTPVYFHPLP